MTLDEFLDDYVPRVLRPMGGWSLNKHKDIRRGECCPLTAGFDRPADDWSNCAHPLGLGLYVAADIAEAADYDGDSDHELTAIRARLLSGLGLTEPSK